MVNRHVHMMSPLTPVLCPLWCDSFSSYAWTPASVRSKIEVYRNQPRSIVDYEPGFSSIAIREAKTVSTGSFLLPLTSLSRSLAWTTFFSALACGGTCVGWD